MNWNEAYTIAKEVAKTLKPHCEFIKIAGSIRRRKSEVKDIEFVVVPKLVKADIPQLFAGTGEFPTVPHPDFIKAVNSLEKIKGTPLGKYCQRRHRTGIKIDIFIARKQNLGVIMAIRTGSADFCTQVLIPQVKRAGYQFLDGALHKVDLTAGSYSARLYPCESEERLFELIDMPEKYLKPENRNL